MRAPSGQSSKKWYLAGGGGCQKLARRASTLKVMELAGFLRLGTDERLHLIYYFIVCTPLLTRGVLVTMEDPPPEETMEQQDLSKRSPRSTKGNICEYSWPEEGGVQELMLKGFLQYFSVHGAAGTCWGAALPETDTPHPNPCAQMYPSCFVHLNMNGMQFRGTKWHPERLGVGDVARKEQRL